MNRACAKPSGGWSRTLLHSAWAAQPLCLKALHCISTDNKQLESVCCISQTQWPYMTTIVQYHNDDSHMPTYPTVILTQYSHLKYLYIHVFKMSFLIVTLLI